MNKKNNKPTYMDHAKAACSSPERGNSVYCPCFQEIEKRFHEIVKKMNTMQELLKPAQNRQTRPCLRSGRKTHLNGETITRIRMKYQLTQTELGLLLDANLTSVNRWERGKTTPCRKMIEKIIIVRDMGCRRIRRMLAEKKQTTQ